VHQNRLQTSYRYAHTAGSTLITDVPDTANVIRENNFFAALNRDHPIPVGNNLKKLFYLR
jgi:hypothetical protein